MRSFPTVRLADPYGDFDSVLIVPLPVSTFMLTQTEALSYARHLAKVAGENGSQPERARALAGMGEDMEKLRHEVFVLLLSKTK